MKTSKSNSFIRQATLRQLQILEVVARTGGYTSAAKELFLTQPTVYTQIKKLSNIIGIPIFDSVGKKLYLTRCGEKVLNTAHEVLQTLDLLDTNLDEMKHEVKGDLDIAVVTTAKYFIPYLLATFLEKYPAVKPNVTVTNRTKVLERLKTNKDDLLIMGKVKESEMAVKMHPFTYNHMHIVASANHRFSNKKNITLKHLSKECFLRREPGSGTRKLITNLFKEANIERENTIQLGSIEAIKQGIMAGMGISVLSNYNVQLEIETGKVVYLNVKGFPLKRFWYAVHPQDKKLSLAAQTFLDFINTEGNYILQNYM